MSKLVYFNRKIKYCRHMYPYGLIGNFQISALISDHGSIDWLCLPRPDSPPVFDRILNPKGDTFQFLHPLLK